MKYLCAICIALLSTASLLADCDFYPGGFYEYCTEVGGDLIFVGELVEEHFEVLTSSNSDSDGDGTPEVTIKLMKIRVDEIWCGEVNETQSEEAPEWAANYQNTQEFIWLSTWHGWTNEYSFLPGRNVIVANFRGYHYECNRCAPYQLRLNDDGTLDGNVYSNPSFGEGPFMKDDLRDNISNNAIDCLSSDIEAIPELEFSLYPVPSNDYVNVFLITDNINNSAVTIRDTSGKILHQESMSTANLRINSSEWEAGIYFVEIRNADGASRVETMIKY